MPEIQLKRDECERILANEESDPSSRLIAAFSIAFFEADNSAEDADRVSLHIAQKLLHMTQAVIYEATGITAQEAS